MATGGQILSGIKVAYSTTSPNVWTRIPQVLSVVLPGFERDRVDVTVHGTTSLRTYIPGLADVRDGELNVLADLDPTSVHMTLSDYERAQTTIWIRYEVPNQADLASAQYMAITMQARVSVWTIEGEIDGRKEVHIVFQFQDNFMLQKAMTSQIT